MRAPAISTDGNVACGTMLWRYRGRLQLTVFVKASFAMVHGGVAAHAGAGIIAERDRTFGENPSRSLEIACDIVPYRARCDVTLRGHAYAPPSRAMAVVAVRLALAREGRWLIDKRLNVVGNRNTVGDSQPFTSIPLTYERARGGPGEVNPVGSNSPNLVDLENPQRAVGVGPVSPYWPERKRLLGSLDRRVLSEPVPSFPEATPWDYFQAAPPDQQSELLLGGEQLVLEGVHPAQPRLETQLPIVRGVAHVFGLQAARPMNWVCDGLAIDGDRQVIDLVWRGRLDIEDEPLSAHWVVAAALQAPGREPDWNGIARRAELRAPATDNVMHRAEVAEYTHALSANAAASAAARSALPFAPAEPPAHHVTAAAPPWVAPPSARDAAAQSAASPLQVPAVQPEVLDVAQLHEQALRARRRDVPGEATFAMRPQDQAALRGQPIAPYALGAPKASPVSPLAPGLPWSSELLVAPPQSTLVGEETLLLGASEAAVSPPSPATDAIGERLRKLGAKPEQVAALLGMIKPPAKKA